MRETLLRIFRRMRDGKPGREKHHGQEWVLRFPLPGSSGRIEKAMTLPTNSNAVNPFLRRFPPPMPEVNFPCPRCGTSCFPVVDGVATLVTEEMLLDAECPQCDYKARTYRVSTARQWNIKPPPAPLNNAPFQSNEAFMNMVRYWGAFLDKLESDRSSWSIDAGRD